ncbi:aminoglycoside adenylyltransferase domain-containing protein, partial [Paenisporosarcina sp.]|uniref:aminoglycoside adenylyltransferase domain-containing protein n=1 Tax=Paenisporosarcina sp. TaxID=1932001 RepID=UPI003C70FC2B
MSEIPTLVQKVLDEYIALVNERLPNTLEEVYLQGSIALGAYVENSSDIDFIGITNRRLLEADAVVLTEIHSKIANRYKHPELDGVYILREDLGRLNLGDDHYINYNSGKLSCSSNFDPIIWWILKTKGIKIVGTERTALDFDIHSKHLISYVNENMNSYWALRVQRMETSITELYNLPVEDIDDEIEWTVLGLLRQFYTLKERDIISKLGAGEYALQHLPLEWHPIIKEAINIRKGEKMNIFTSDKERIDMTIRFSKYIIHYC